MRFLKKLPGWGIGLLTGIWDTIIWDYIGWASQSFCFKYFLFPIAILFFLTSNIYYNAKWWGEKTEAYFSKKQFKLPNGNTVSKMAVFHEYGNNYFEYSLYKCDDSNHYKKYSLPEMEYKTTYKITSKKGKPVTIILEKLELNKKETIITLISDNISKPQEKNYIFETNIVNMKSPLYEVKEMRTVYFNEKYIEKKPDISYPEYSTLKSNLFDILNQIRKNDIEPGLPDRKNNDIDLVTLF